MAHSEYTEKKKRMLTALKEVLPWVGPKPFSAHWIAAHTKNRELRELLTGRNGKGINQLFKDAGCVRHDNPNQERGRWLRDGKLITLWRA